MAASKSTFQAFLKEFYVGSTVEKQLNNECKVLEVMQKATVQWNGLQFVIPIHTARNTGVGSSSNAVLPTAGAQTYKRLTGDTAHIYGRFEVDGPAMAAAAGSKGSFLSWMQAELIPLKDDIKNLVDRYCTSGGRAVGFLNQHRAEAGGIGVYSDWDFRGDFDKLEAAITAKGGDVLVRLVNLSATEGSSGNYNSIGGNVTYRVRSVNKAAGTISIEDIDSAGAVALDTTGVDAGYAIGVVIVDTDGALDYLDSEPVGIYGNLILQTHWGVSRDSSVAGSAPILQSNCLTQATTSTHDAAALTLERLQYLIDLIELRSGKAPDVLMVNPLFRSRYTTLLTQNIQKAAEKASKGDGGFKGLSYGDIPITAFRQVDNGMMIFLHKSEWKFLENEKGKFADEDGNILSRVSNKDAYEGYYKWRFNTVCVRPNASGVLVGLTMA